MKNDWDFDRNCTESVDPSGSADILKTFFPSKNSQHLHFCCVFFSFLHCVLYFAVCRFLTSLVKFIAKYFILFLMLF